MHSCSQWVKELSRRGESPAGAYERRDGPGATAWGQYDTNWTALPVPCSIFLYRKFLFTVRLLLITYVLQKKVAKCLEWRCQTVLRGTIWLCDLLAGINELPAVLTFLSPADEGLRKCCRRFSTFGFRRQFTSHSSSRHPWRETLDKRITRDPFRQESIGKSREGSKSIECTDAEMTCLVEAKPSSRSIAWKKMCFCLPVRERGGGRECQLRLWSCGWVWLQYERGSGTHMSSSSNEEVDDEGREDLNGWR